MRRTPCEVSVREVVPAVRAALSIMLVRERGLSVYKAAKILDVAPAAVSNYLSARRSREEYVEKLLKDEKYSKDLREFTEKLLKEEAQAGDVICYFCRKLLKEEELECPHEQRK
ncbi:MAG: hypothetical protein B7O98_06450 [Zestosphaera tikiterensis]|uniref:Transcriptional regulator n=1 Tax=Zestosphaera tikiterensis TaxID=1973259 RepID=A0A2R7Y452_9CREN|nr:MAG: hypothetical protein B7O98_06450 [Zestosphaera tikiterensis]